MAANNEADLFPISSWEFDKWMSAIGYFECNVTIAVAISGGSDSMALLLLAQDWVRARNGKLIALTVNHNLRLEAADEALQVKQWCATHNIEHHTLCWQHSTPQTSNIQANARDARYQLMTEYCHKNNILHLLTAHHCDDQVETLFFRLARGSGLEGLSAMSAQTVISGVRLLRPLLQIPKSRLMATLKEKNQLWLEDPSNQNTLYTRVCIRKKLTQNTSKNAIRTAANNLTNNLGKFRNLLENKIASQLTNAIEIYNQGYASIIIDGFNLLDKEIALKSLSALIQTISGSPHPPRKEKLVGLYDAIYTNKLNTKRSLGGLLFEKMLNHKILVYREIQAIAPPCLIDANIPMLWDNRFMVEWKSENSLPTTLELRALGSNGLAYISKTAPWLLKNAPLNRILRTIPSLWLLEELVSVPHIRYMNEKSQFSALKAVIQFIPTKPLAGSCFFVMNNQA
ncbi:MAG: tRNA lysidine(34) synthetase TilS [Rickettsiales bacterium]